MCGLYLQRYLPFTRSTGHARFTRMLGMLDLLEILAMIDLLTFVGRLVKLCQALYIWHNKEKCQFLNIYFPINSVLGYTTWHQHERLINIPCNEMVMSFCACCTLVLDLVFPLPLGPDSLLLSGELSYTQSDILTSVMSVISYTL